MSGAAEATWTLPCPLPADAVRTSVTRNAVLDGTAVAPVPRDSWETGDYAVGAVVEELPRSHTVESPTGRLVEVVTGDAVVGALGVRAATLEAVGDWRQIGRDGRMHALTRAGVLGRVASAAAATRSELVPLVYQGHVVRDGEKLRMRDTREPAKWQPLRAPVVIVIGTSMSAGKTTGAATIIRLLRRRGLHVAAGKVTGVARYADILQMADAGAGPVHDFVDAGLPSTICSPDEYEEALRYLLGRLAASVPDVVVLECGASPLEPYNVDRAVDLLGPHVRCTMLCASDPFAVVGVARAFGTRPDVVAGRATSTTAGAALIERLAGVPAVNVLDARDHPRLDALLRERLDLA